MQIFENIFKSHTAKTSSKWHHYFEVYDRHLSHLINQEFTLLEIGIAGGGSLQLWKKYFGSKVKIVGIDINPETMYNEYGIETFAGDQSDKSFLTSVVEKIGSPQVVIDDGSHVQSHILKSFEVLYPKLTDTGTYIIEDCHTAYWPRFEGGVNSHLNIVEILSKTAHDVNTKWYNEPRTPKVKQLNSLHFYDSMIILEKRPEKFNRLMVNVDEQGPKIMEIV